MSLERTLFEGKLIAMKAGTLLACAYLAGIADAQTALDEITVLKCAEQVELVAAQAQGLAKIAESVQSLVVERDKEVEQYILSETGLSKLVDKMLSKTALSNEEQVILKRAEQGKLGIVEKFRVRTDQQIQRVIALLTDKQLFTVALHRNAYEAALKLVQKIRSASPEEWPQVRGNLAHRITDDEYYRVYTEASAEWERATGKRTAVNGSGFSAKAAGIEDQLEAIRESGREYLEQIRNTGAPQNRLNEVAGMLLKRSVQVLRRWPPNENDRLNLGMPDGVPMTQLYQLEVQGSNSPYYHARLFEDFLHKLLMTPGAPQTLEKLAGQIGSVGIK